MSELSTQGIVRILNGNGDVGTGFVISKSGLIATCSHVVQQGKLQESGEPRPEKVTVIFYATGDEQDARVLSQWWLPWNDGDVAILQLQGLLPQGVQPLPLGPAEGTSGHNISTFGFPYTGVIEGLGGNGRVVRVLKEAGRPILQLQSGEITVGFSGAPIWDKLGRRVIGMVSAIMEPDEHQRLVKTAFAVSAETLRTVCPILHVSEVCPYRGLAAFREADAEFFFGRQKFVDNILNRLRSELRFLTILGPSGSGKSSVVQAGFIPQLKSGKIPGSDHWEAITVRLADNPFAELEKQGLSNGANDLTESVQAWQRQHPEQERLVLVFDPFEEVFVTWSDELRQKFIEQIVLLLQSSLLISIILVMRDDFYSRITQYEKLVKWLEQSRGPIHIPQTLKQDELTAMVQKPAEAVGLQFEEGLVEIIVRDTLEASIQDKNDGQLGRSAVLPLLEFALYELWKRRYEGMFTHEAYSKIGTVAGALTQWADQAFFELKNDEEQRLASRIFTDLVYLGNKDQGILDSRRRQTKDSLYRNNNERQGVEHVIQHLVEKRLLTTDRDLQTGDEIIEIIHDVLLRTWGKLKHWIEEDRAFLEWHQEIERLVHRWADQRDKNKLLRGRDLTKAKVWLKRRETDLSQSEIVFIRAGTMQRTLKFVRVATVFLLLVSVAGLAGWYYLHQAADPALVTTLNDDGPGSFRYCINNIQSGTIRFTLGLKGVIKLTSGALTIKGNVTIDGPGSEILAVSSVGTTNSAIFISSGASVTINGLSFRNSSLFDNDFINNDGTLSLVNSTISNNNQQQGHQNKISGGIIQNSHVLSVINSNILHNSSFNQYYGGSYGGGGGIGGGINNFQGVLTVINSTISGNAADEGGGIYSDHGTVIVMNSTISGNTALHAGGGINTSGGMKVINSTFAGNSVGNSSELGNGGGAIYTDCYHGCPIPALLAFDTIYGNTSPTIGGAVNNTGATITIEDSIIAANNTVYGSDIAGGNLVTGGYNLLQNVDKASIYDPNRLKNTDMVIQTNDLSNIFGSNPQLRDNGGATKTYALLPGSSDPAINKIPVQYCHIPEIFDQKSHHYTDQRGILRPDGSKKFCNIGASEATETSTASTVQPRSTVTLHPTPTISSPPQPEKVTEFMIPSTSGSSPEEITAGSDGNLWFTDDIGNKIGRITLTGTITEFAIPTSGSLPKGITTGLDGNLWFTESGANKIGRITSTGTITEFVIPTTTSGPTGITAGPNGNLWFTESGANKIGRITSTGTITEFTIPTSGSSPKGITTGPDGNLWFTDDIRNQIGRITPTGTITEFALPTSVLPQLSGVDPSGITAGPDGNLWFTEDLGNKIGRITPTGIITEFFLFPLTRPVGITVGPDGNLWFTESWAGQIGRITPKE